MTRAELEARLRRLLEDATQAGLKKQPKALADVELRLAIAMGAVEAYVAAAKPDA